MVDLFDIESSDHPPVPGYRLSKLEVYNWGTFDKTVHSVSPQGQNTLLVGKNGSGKSTLVDALLTLLVRPQTRNYNVAAGAMKNERDERTYIRGAYDRIVGDAGRPQIQYLRSENSHYTALLGCFSNEYTGKTFTLCQVLFLGNDNSVEKTYAYCDGTKGIVEDLSGIASANAVGQHLRDRGFNTTSTYKQYFKWLQRKTGFRDKAMDIFNQTVAVKDVQRLDLFIRQHMLEAKPWREKTERLLSHFSELSDAHRTLVRVRLQDELLRPVSTAGKRYLENAFDVQLVKRQLDACDYYFALETDKLLTPLCQSWQQEIKFLCEEILRLDSLQDQLRDDIARINIEIENAGGDRLKQLPILIEQAQELAEIKRDARHRFESQLRTAGLAPTITSPDQFRKTRSQIETHRKALTSQRNAARQQSGEIQFQIGSLSQQISRDCKELEALRKRKNNLPESLICLRDSICRDLNLAPSDLPFAAELMCVSEEEKEWEASIEQVLYGFARSLLVPEAAYKQVASYIDSTLLRDSHGHGQRLVYLKVSESTNKRLKTNSDAKLGDKIQYRNSHPSAAWVKSEVHSRFNLRACQSLEEFHRAKSPAMTKNRHFKSGSSRHEKNDRFYENDRKHFVLGWNTTAKRNSLTEGIQANQDAFEQLKQRDLALANEIDRTTAALGLLETAGSVDEFSMIDYEQHEFEASQLLLEKQQLEEADDLIVQLKIRRDKLEAELRGHKVDRDDNIAQRSIRKNELSSGQVMLENARDIVSQTEANQQTDELAEQFGAVASFSDQPLAIANLGTLPLTISNKLRRKFEKLQERLGPISRDLTSAMTRYLRKFPDEQADLDAHVESLSSFQALYERIATDDLPKHELRFKKRLNEKVLLEVGMLHGSLEDDRQEIRDKIEQLNHALRLLQWRPGTYMRLEPSDSHDKEIQDFRRELAACLSGTLDGAPEENEAAFVRIEKLVERLRDPSGDRWRQKVIDVRNWFNFAAREIVAESGESGSYYDGGTGQSGGEKGKLAFLVLVAAIAYQFNLDPDSDDSSRFQFVMVDEMFSRSDDQHAEYALDLFNRFGLQLLIVAPLDAKARVTEPYVGTYLHVIKDPQTHQSELLSITAEELAVQSSKL